MKSIAVLKQFFKDARLFQILFLSSFLVYGFLNLNWDSNILGYGLILICGLSTQWFFNRKYSKNQGAILSGLITCLGLALLLKSGQPAILGLASILAIGSKFLIRRNGKHIYNPANFGIIAAIFLTGNAWVSPGQWGSDAVFWFFFGGAALMVLLKVGRIDTGLVFLFGLFFLDFMKIIVYQGWNAEVLIHKYSNGALLLYSFFMITDPMTTPNHGKARVFWALSLALLTFWLQSFWHVQTAAIWSLFLISPFTLLFDKFFKAEKFVWEGSKVNFKPVQKGALIQKSNN